MGVDEGTVRKDRKSDAEKSAPDENKPDNEADFGDTSAEKSADNPLTVDLATGEILDTDTGEALDETYTIDRMASDLEDAEELLSGKRKPDAHFSGESKERQDAA